MAEIRFYRLGSTDTTPTALDVSRANTLNELLVLVMCRAPQAFHPKRINFIVNGTKVYRPDLDSIVPDKITHVVIRETESRAEPLSFTERDVYVIE